MDKKILDLLYSSFDNTLTPREKEMLDSALEQSEELRREREKIAATRQIIAENSGETFKPFFAERVMRRLESLREKTDPALDLFESLVYMFRRVAFVGAVAAVILFSVQLLDTDHETNEINETVSEMTLDEVLNSAFSPSLEDIL